MSRDEGPPWVFWRIVLYKHEQTVQTPARGHLRALFISIWVHLRSNRVYFVIAEVPLCDTALGGKVYRGGRDVSHRASSALALF